MRRQSSGAPKARSPPTASSSPPTNRRLKSVKDDFLKKALCALEPELFTDEVFASPVAKLDRAAMEEILSFALALPSGAPFPSTFDSLTFTNPLILYFGLRYTQLGRRLSKYTIGSRPGYFHYAGGVVKLAIDVEGSAAAYTMNYSAIVAVATDWKLIGNHSLSSVALRSDEEDQTINIMSRFKKQFGNLVFPTETADWHFVEQTLPAIIIDPVPDDMARYHAKQKNAPMSSKLKPPTRRTGLAALAPVAAPSSDASVSSVVAAADGQVTPRAPPAAEQGE